MDREEIRHEIKALASIWNETIKLLDHGDYHAARTQATTIRSYLERFYNNCLDLYSGDRYRTKWIKHNHSRMIKPLWWAEHYSLSAERDRNSRDIIEMAKNAKAGCKKAIDVLEELDEIITK